MLSYRTPDEYGTGNDPTNFTTSSFLSRHASFTNVLRLEGNWLDTQHIKVCDYSTDLYRIFGYLIPIIIVLAILFDFFMKSYNFFGN